MKVQCPDCKGRRQVEVAVTAMNPIMGVVGPRSGTLNGSATYVTRMKPCTRCQETGRVDETERAVVMQDGRRVGYLPPNFNPATVKSTSFFYTPRPSDFRREGDVWIADHMLGPGDLEAVPGFVWDRA